MELIKYEGWIGKLHGLISKKRTTLNSQLCFSVILHERSSII